MDPITEMTNEKFVAYYKAQNLMGEEEWGPFMDTLRKPLPINFRVTPLTPSAEEATAYIRAMATAEDDKEAAAEPAAAGAAAGEGGAEEESKERPYQLEWFPGGWAWQLNMTKRDLRRHSKLGQLHKWLVSQTDVGTVSRQEAVSMIPPLFLDVQPEHRVLDMCASPGSKTAQLLEALHDKEYDGKPATGVVVANDNNAKRAYLLVHQCRRIGSHRMLITCHDGQNIPVPGERLAGRKGALKPLDGAGEEGYYDRVLADVPCSGDGTLRKTPELWKRWTAASGLGLHRLQLAIAVRGAQLLRVGGLMVYSTCTFNPVENEAVVASLLQAGKGSIELVDASGALPALKRRPGLHKWQVIDKAGQHFASAAHLKETLDRVVAHRRALRDAVEAAKKAQCEEAGVEEGATEDKDGNRLPFVQVSTAEDDQEIMPGVPYKKFRLAAANGVAETCFPPAAEEAAALHLERCMRFLPHDSNTGGFFVCLLRKVAPWPKDATVPPLAAAAAAGAGAGAADSKAENDEGEQDAEEEAVAEAPTAKRRATEAKDGSIVPVHEPVTLGDAESVATPEWMDPQRDVVYAPLGPEMLKECRETFGLSEDFPLGSLFVRMGSERGTTVHAFAEPVAKDMLHPMLRGVQTGRRPRLKLVQGGVKVMEKRDGVLRPMQDGVHLLSPFMTKRIYRISTADFAFLIAVAGIFFPCDATPSPNLREILMSMKRGGNVVVLDPNVEETPALAQQDAAAASELCKACRVLPARARTLGTLDGLPLVVWRGIAKFNLMAAKGDVQGFAAILKHHGIDLPEPPKLPEKPAGDKDKKEEGEAKEEAAAAPEEKDE